MSELLTNQTVNYNNNYLFINTITMINDLTKQSILAIKEAAGIVQKLSLCRTKQKLSSHRTSNIVKELKELCKVLACDEQNK